MSIYSEMRDNHAEVLRAVRAQHGQGNGQVVPKNDDYKNVAMIWCKVQARGCQVKKEKESASCRTDFSWSKLTRST